MPDARSIQRAWMARQRAWADSHGIELASETSLLDWRDNLLAPIASECDAALDPTTRAHYDLPEKPGRLHALGSGLALALNVFEPWRSRPSELSARVPRFFPADARMRFAVEMPDGPATEGPPLEIDLLIEGDDSAPTAVIPLFCEPFEDIVPRVRDPLGRDAGVFAGLDGCGLLARDLHCHPRRFARLDVGRVLETALALDRRYGAHSFRIAVLWFDAGGHASRRFQRELHRVRMRIGGEIDLLAATWQEVLSALLSDSPDRSETALDDGYSTRIRARYGPAARDSESPVRA